MEEHYICNIKLHVICCYTLNNTVFSPVLSTFFSMEHQLILCLQCLCCLFTNKKLNIEFNVNCDEFSAA